VSVITRAISNWKFPLSPAMRAVEKQSVAREFLRRANKEDSRKVNSSFFPVMKWEFHFIVLENSSVKISPSLCTPVLLCLIIAVVSFGSQIS